MKRRKSRWNVVFPKCGQGFELSTEQSNSLFVLYTDCFLVPNFANHLEVWWKFGTENVFVIITPLSEGAHLVLVQWSTNGKVEVRMCTITGDSFAIPKKRIKPGSPCNSAKGTDWSDRCYAEKVGRTANRNLIRPYRLLVTLDDIMLENQAHEIG